MRWNTLSINAQYFEKVLGAIVLCRQYFLCNKIKAVALTALVCRYYPMIPFTMAFAIFVLLYSFASSASSTKQHSTSIAGAFV